MILSRAKIKSYYSVDKIIASEKDKRKLYKLGVFKKVKIYLVEKIAGGGVIVSVSGSDIIIGKKVAEKIEVNQC